MDIHHIFPYAWCQKNSIDPELRESIVNKTMLSAKTNRTIGGSAPSLYLPKIESNANISSDELDGILQPHLVSPDALRNDAFMEFFNDRREAVCQLIETALEKPVPRDTSEGVGAEDAAHFVKEDL